MNGKTRLTPTSFLLSPFALSCTKFFTNQAVPLGVSSCRDTAAGGRCMKIQDGGEAAMEVSGGGVWGGGWGKSIA